MIVLYRNHCIDYTASMDTSSIQHHKIRVLYVIESFSTGVYAIVRDIACNLNPKLFEIMVIHSLRNDSPTDYKIDFSQANITLNYVPMASLKDYLKAIRYIREKIQTFQPDTIHLHSSKAGFLGRLAAHRKSYKNLLYSPHGFAFLRTDVPVMKRWIFLQLEKWVNWYTPGIIIAVSKGELTQALRITKKSVAINNFIDTSLIPVNDNPSGFDIVTSGRIAPQKNPTLFNTIAKALPHLTFLWIGDGPLRSQLDAENITITGYISRKQAIDHVSNATIYLQPSLWEGMPVSILEAMAAAKPVVASDIIGNKDLIQDGVTGFLCAPTSPDQFQKIISRLLSEKELRDSIRIKARDYVRTHHDVHQAVKAYEEIYGSL